VALAQLIRFLVVKLTYLGSNPRFDMSVVFMTNYFLVGGDIPVDSESLLITNFVNLKIKSVKSFEGAHRGRMCMSIFIGVNAHTCMSIYICTVSKKRKENETCGHLDCNSYKDLLSNGHNG
jgi:hypothetical protein